MMVEVSTLTILRSGGYNYRVKEFEESDGCEWEEESIRLWAPVEISQEIPLLVLSTQEELTTPGC